MLQELLDKRAKLVKDWRDFLDKQEGGLNAEAKAKSDKMEADIDALDAQINALKKQQKLEQKLNEPLNEPIFGDVKGSDNKFTYKNAFERFVRGNLTSDFKAVLSEGTGSEGGYLVPEEYQKTILEKLAELSRTRAISTVISTSSTRNIPIGGELPNFAWVDENGAYGESNTSFAKAQLGAYKVGGIIKVSEELLQDSAIDLETYLSGLIARGIASIEGNAFAIGDGSKKPTGYTNKTADITLSTTDGVTADELIDIYFALKAPYRANATWRLNGATLKLIRKLKDNNGSYIYSPAMQVGERDILLGRPIEEDPYLPVPGANNKIITLGDFSYYYIADRGNMEIQRLIERYADLGQVGFKVTKRVDAKITVDEAFVVAQNAAS